MYSYSTKHKMLTDCAVAPTLRGNPGSNLMIWVNCTVCDMFRGLTAEAKSHCWCSSIKSASKFTVVDGKFIIKYFAPFRNFDSRVNCSGAWTSFAVSKCSFLLFLCVHKWHVCILDLVFVLWLHIAIQFLFQFPIPNLVHGTVNSHFWKSPSTE